MFKERLRCCRRFNNICARRVVPIGVPTDRHARQPATREVFSRLAGGSSAEFAGRPLGSRRIEFADIGDLDVADDSVVARDVEVARSRAQDLQDKGRAGRLCFAYTRHTSYGQAKGPSDLHCGRGHAHGSRDPKDAVVLPGCAAITPCRHIPPHRWRYGGASTL